MQTSAIRNFFKWVCTAFLAAWLVVWPLSGWFTAIAPRTALGEVAIHAGAVWVVAGLNSTRVGATRIPGRLTFLYADGIGDDGHFEMSFLHDQYGVAYLAIPIWAIVLAILIPAALLWRGDMRRVIRRRRGQCLGCGYDRRATPAGAVCPECGEPVHAALSAPM